MLSLPKGRRPLNPNKIPTGRRAIRERLAPVADLIVGHRMYEVFPMFKNVLQTVSERRHLLFIIGGLYVLSITVGLATGFLRPSTLESWIDRQDQVKNEQMEKVFGTFRQPVREGNLAAMGTSAGIIFGFNMFGSLTNTVSSILLVPIFFNLVLGGWIQGISLASLHGSSFQSVFLFLLMGGLEWITYVVSAGAGANIGLAVLSPKRVGCSFRAEAFKRVVLEAGRLYVLIITVLAVQAVFEILYVQKVLLMGGTGVPLMPY